MYVGYHSYKEESSWVRLVLKGIYKNKKLELTSYYSMDILHYSRNFLYRCRKIGSISVIVNIMHGNHLCFYFDNLPYSIVMSEVL